MQDEEREWLAAVGLRIRLGRVVRRETQRELAARCGLSPVTLGSIERGDHAAGVLAYVRVAAALGVAVGELVGKGPQTPEDGSG